MTDTDTTIATSTEITTFGDYSSYTEHLAAVNAANPNLFLGFLAWYTVPEAVEIDHTEFTKLALKANAPLAVKQAPKAGDVFLRACTTIEGTHRGLPTTQPGTYRNYLIRKAGSDSDWICKQVVRELVDGEEHQLDFEIMGDIRFHKRTFKMDVKPTPLGAQDAEFAEIAADIARFYAAKEMLLTAYTVRESIRRALEGPMQALSVRSAGGVYFVNAKKFADLAAIEKLVADIPLITFNVMPLIDDANQRDMVRVAYEGDSVGELQKLMAEMIELQEKKGKITTKQLVAFQTRYADLKARTASYAELLDDSLGTASASLQLCSTVIQGMIKKSAVEDLV